MMKKAAIFLMGCFFFSLLISQVGLSCTSFYIEQDNMKVVGSNMDFPWGDGLTYVNNRHVSKTAVQQFPDQEAAEWTSKYGSITFSLIAREMPNGGMNEAGLTVIGLYLFETVDPIPDSRPYVAGGPNWVQYQLDNCSTVSEVIDTASQIRSLNELNHLAYTREHFFVSDSDGNAAVIEFLNGEMVCHSSDDTTSCDPMSIRAITNNTYSDSITWWTDYLDTGACPYTPDCSSSASPERFIRAAERLHTYDGIENPVSYAFDTLAEVSSQGMTQWSIVYDIQNRGIHFRTAGNQNIRDVYLNSFDFSCETPVELLDINSDLSGDVSNDFIDYTQETNRNLVEACYLKMNLPIESAEPIWRHPEENTFCIPAGDFNEDGCVDRADYYIIIGEIRGPAPHDMVYDLNDDGNVNIADARYLARLFTNPRGVACE